MWVNPDQFLSEGCSYANIHVLQSNTHVANVSVVELGNKIIQFISTFTRVSPCAPHHFPIIRARIRVRVRVTYLSFTLCSSSHIPSHPDHKVQLGSGSGSGPCTPHHISIISWLWLLSLQNVILLRMVTATS